MAWFRNWAIFIMIASNGYIDLSKQVIDSMPEAGFFKGCHWRCSPIPLVLNSKVKADLLRLGKVFAKFLIVCSLLYRQSIKGKQPTWVAELLDKGKPDYLISLQRHSKFIKALPNIIRPDLLITEDGLVLTELDNVPGGIGLTAWLNEVYSKIHKGNFQILGGPDGMLNGFGSIFNVCNRVDIVVSAEADMYRPEMEWLARRLNNLKPGMTNVRNYQVRDQNYSSFVNGQGVYRFFELFDLDNVPSAKIIFEGAINGEIFVTPPPTSFIEEKMLMAFFWNQNLEPFWRRELGDAYFYELRKVIPRSWLMDPSPLPPHAGIPGLDIPNWHQLKNFSQRQKELIIKISGFSERAWGAKSVVLGSDVPAYVWANTIDEALASFDKNPFILQEYKKPSRVPVIWYDADANQVMEGEGRVRLCPYYFFNGDIENIEVTLGGVLATICPVDKKIIHGMSDAILVPCAYVDN